MDSRDRDRELVKSILTDYASIPYAHGAIECETVFDCEADRYLLMLVGWEGIRRVHGCLIHVDLIDEKIWVQRDGTERGVARDLIEAGVPEDRIVLAFRSPETLLAERQASQQSDNRQRTAWMPKL
jgi:hypothetical protein